MYNHVKNLNPSLINYSGTDPRQVLFLHLHLAMVQMYLGRPTYY